MKRTGLMLKSYGWVVAVGLGKMFGAIELTLLGPAVPAVTCDDIFVQNRETG